MSVQRSPLVTRIAWGEIDIDGVGMLKDAKLYPGGARAWDWRETGTRHSPGIQPADVDDILASGATVVILSRGMDLQLEVMPATLELLTAKGVEVHVLETREAVSRYNELATSTPVGALIHSTC